MLGARFVCGRVDTRGGLPETRIGIRKRCVRVELSFVASWSEAHLTRLELACWTRAFSRLCLGSRCWGG